MGSTYLFAAENDWLPVFSDVEGGAAVEYAAAGVFPINSISTFRCGTDLPHRGRSTARATVECEYFLASSPPSALTTEAVTAADGVTRYYLSQRRNPQTIELCMGGIWQEGVLISGRVATVSDAPESMALMRRFERALRRRFRRIRAALVGPSAGRLLREGWRLTTAAHSPRTYDLAPE